MIIEFTKKLISEAKKLIKRIMSSGYGKTAVIMTLLIVILNILRISEGFCNFFTANIMPVFLNTYGRFSGDGFAGGGFIDDDSLCLF